MTSDPAITFRPLARADLPRLHTWLAESEPAIEAACPARSYVVRIWPHLPRARR